MRITELFLEPQEYHWVDPEDAEFIINDIKYEVYFSELDDYEFETWEVTFSATELRPNSEIISDFGLTNTGNAAKVMSTVLAIIKEFIKNHQDIILYFTAREESRKALYEKIIKRLNMKYRVEERKGLMLFWVET